MDVSVYINKYYHVVLSHKDLPYIPGKDPINVGYNLINSPSSVIPAIQTQYTNFLHLSG